MTLFCATRTGRRNKNPAEAGFSYLARNSSSPRRRDRIRCIGAPFELVGRNLVRGIGPASIVPPRKLHYLSACSPPACPWTLSKAPSKPPVNWWPGSPAFE